MRLKLFLILIFCTAAVNLCAQSNKVADLKAAYIYNFILYTEWDSSQVRNGYTVGVLGNSSVASSLNTIAGSTLAKNRRIIVRRFQDPNDIGYCNILFIPANLPYSLPSILERLPKGTLTVSEEYGYGRQGTALNFIIQNNKLKFEANLQAIVSSGLRVSSRLLKLAIIVD